MWRIVPWMPAAAAAVVSVVLALHATSLHGLALSRDSVSYISAARGLAAGEGLLDFDGSPYLHWPPLYPVLLAVPATLGVDAPVAARAVNTAALALAVLCACVWLARSGRHPGLAAVACLSLALSGPFVLVSVHAWSESVLLALTLVPLLLMNAAVAGRPLAWAALLLVGALAGLQRYAGLAVPLAVSLTLWWARGGGPAWKPAALLAVAGVAPGALWLLTHVPARPPPLFAPGDQLVAALGTLGGWLTGPVLPELTRAALALVLIGVLAWRGSRIESCRSPGGIYLTAFVPIYVAVIAVASQGVLVNRMDDRYLSPLCAPLLLLAVAVLDESVPARSALACVLTLALVPSTVRKLAEAHEWHRSGVPGSLKDATSATHPLVEALATMPRDVHPYCNQPWLFYLWTGRRAAGVPRSRDEALRLQQCLESTVPTILFWFGPIDQVQIGALPELADRVRSKWLWRRPQGAIIQLGLAPAPR